MPAKKPTIKKSTAPKATMKKVPVKRATAKATAKRSTMPARPGDLIVIDSPQVGSSPREGEVLEVIQGEVSVSYRVKWADGRQTLIAPGSGTARIVGRATQRG